MTDTERTFRFTFTVQDGPLWANRSLQEWLDTLLIQAGHLTASVGIDTEPHPDDIGDRNEIRVNVVGTEGALRFACVALNLQAEQTPWDGTSSMQAKALEAVLSAPDDRLPDNPHGMVAALELAVEIFRDEDFRSQMVGRSDAGLDSVVDRLNDVIGLADDWVRDYESHLTLSGLTPGGSCRGR